MDNIETLEMIQYHLSGTALLTSICAAVFFGVWAITAGREGNTKLSRIFSALGCLSALKHNAPIDRYKTDDDTVYPETTTLSTYLDAMKHRSVTEDDLKIMQLLLDSDADTRVVHDEFDPYSVILGKAAWSVLYNDDEVTDVEVELIQLMKDNGCIEDSKMADEHCSFWTYPGYREGVYCGLNYYKVLGLLGSFG